MPERQLEVSRLAVAFGAARVLDSVDLTVPMGSVIGLVGPNGSGKTTTLRAISGLVARQAGTVKFDGKELPQRPEVVASRRVIHVPENRGLMRTLSVRQNLRLGAIAVGAPFSDQELAPILRSFPLIDEVLDRRAGLLSGGEQQMVAIARGLLAQPSIMMVDEMSLGLAPKVVQAVLSSALEAANSRGIGLLLVDQNVSALSKLCDAVYVLQNGRSVRTSADDPELLNAVYLGHSTSHRKGSL